jgi:hypothetical protein
MEETAEYTVKQINKDKGVKITVNSDLAYPCVAFNTVEQRED